MVVELEELDRMLNELMDERDERDMRERKRIKEMYEEMMCKRLGIKSLEERCEERYGKIVKEFKERKGVVGVVENKKIDRDEIVKKMVNKLELELRMMNEGLLDKEEMKRWNVIRLKMMRRYGIGYERGIEVRVLMNKLEVV